MTPLVRIARRLARAVDRLAFDAPVSHVYDPLDYAWRPHRQYLTRYGTPPREVLLVGMNPGPWGMVQTGVPFGDVVMVREWLGIEAPVGQPPHPHPKRPVMGFACRRREGSGRRLWGWAQQRFGTPKRFFARFLVVNYCPLALFDAQGRNLTPDRLPRADREPLLAACDDALARTIRALAPAHLVGIGRFAEARLAAVAPPGARVTFMPHPSPASPAANRGWEALADAALTQAGISVG